MITSSPIKKRVLQIISQKIKEVEDGYREECEKIDTRAQLQKEAAMEEAVNSIIGKVL